MKTSKVTVKLYFPYTDTYKLPKYVKRWVKVSNFCLKNINIKNAESKHLEIWTCRVGQQYNMIICAKF